MTELQKQDRVIKKLKLRNSILRKEVLEKRKRLNTLTTQYEAVIKESKKIIDDLLDNAPKLFFIYLSNRYKRMRGKL